MRAEEFKALTASVKELSKDYANIAYSLKRMEHTAKATKQLWRNGNKPLLIKVGLALIVFPEPIISDALGTFLLAAGAVQEGVRRQALYIDVLPKAFRNVMKDLKDSKNQI